MTLTSYAVYNLYFHPVAKFPGPWYAGISEVSLRPASHREDDLHVLQLFYSYTIISGSAHLTLKALHDQYGTPPPLNATASFSANNA